MLFNKLNLILCNSNRSRKDRLELLSYFQRNGFTSILVNFDIPDPILQERVIKSQRSTAIFRFVSNFEEVLTRQQAETDKEDIKAPLIDEADHLFVIKKEPEVQSVIQRIVTLEANV